VCCLAPLVEPILSYYDGKVIAYGPEALVKEPVGRLGKRDAIGGMIAAAFFELVDVGSVKGGFAVQRDHPVMR
jgi:hypothetical protein